MTKIADRAQQDRERRVLISIVFQDQPSQHDQAYRRVIVGLLLLSCLALAVTIWIMVDFLREQQVVDELISSLPKDAKESAEFLAGELRWQFRLTILVVLNVVVTAIAVVLLWRAYRASQSSLRDVRALANDVISSMEQGVITTDLNGTITSVNKRGLSFLGVGPDCIGKAIGNVAPDSLSEFHKHWLRNKTTGFPHEYSLEQRGSSKTFRATCQTLTDRNSSEIGAVIQLMNITEQKLIEERMRRMERYMGLGSLAVGLHHEIKNPLAALSLHVQLLEERLESNEQFDETESMLRVIRSEVTRIGGVLEGFRDFASIDQLQSSDVNLREMLEQKITFIRPQANSQRVEVELNECDPMLKISADRGRIEQAVLNLAINALEAMPNGGRFSISARDEGGDIYLTFADTGTGIPENLRNKVLDPYFTTKGSGTGLGLAFCEKIMRQHNGTIDFKASGEGTTFILKFPKPKNPATK